jgi:hypothetical protein
MPWTKLFKHVRDLIPLAAQLADKVCDAAKHPAVHGVVGNEQRSKLAVEMLRILLQEEKEEKTNGAPASLKSQWSPRG